MGTPEFQDAVSFQLISLCDLDQDIDYAREMLRNACRRALEACSSRPATSPEEDLH